MKKKLLTYKINRIIVTPPVSREPDGRALQHSLLGNRSMVGHRTLTPPIKVQILVPQPNRINHLHNDAKFPIFYSVFDRYNIVSQDDLKIGS